jgi:hypothetical protein
VYLLQGLIAGTLDTVMPMLILRLIAEAGDGITELDVPGGSGTAAVGSTALSRHAVPRYFVPARRSVSSRSA